MKIRELLNERTAREPSSVEYEMLVGEDTDEPHYEIIEIVGDVITTPDPFATGDSPEEQEFEPRRAIVQRTGQPFDLKNIPEKDWQWIIDKAVDNYNRFR